jgi:hypothetical protein
VVLLPCSPKLPRSSTVQRQRFMIRPSVTEEQVFHEDLAVNFRDERCAQRFSYLAGSLSWTYCFRLLPLRRYRRNRMETPDQLQQVFENQHPIANAILAFSRSILVPGCFSSCSRKVATVKADASVWSTFRILSPTFS